MSRGDAADARPQERGRAMFLYTATDLVEILRRETGTAAANPRHHVTKSPSVLQQLRQRAISGVTAMR
jgi:hypothetical protein